MKNANRVFSIILIAGVILAAIGISVGANSMIYWNRDGIKIAPKETSVVEQEFDSVEDIKILSMNSKIVIKDGDTFGVKATYLINQPIISLENGKLNIDMNDKWEQKFSIGLQWNKGAILEVTVPEYFNNLKITNDNGSVTLSNFAADSIDVDIDNGKITIENVNSRIAKTKTDNGSVTLSNVDADSIDVDTDNGRITIENVNSRIGNIKADNGRISAFSFACDIANLKANNGKIIVAGAITGENTYRTDNGSIQIEVDETAGVSYNLVTENGSVRYADRKYGNFYSHERDGEVKINASTENGSIKVFPYIQ